MDAAMVDGAALLAGMMHGLQADGQWHERGTNLLDGGAWFYEVYETADGRYVSLGAIDARSCAELVQLTGLADDVDGGGPVPDPADQSSWPAMKVRMAALMRTRSATSGARCWRARTPASPPCSTPAGARAPPPAGAGDLHRGGRRRAAGAGAPVQQDGSGRQHTAAGARCPRRGAGGLGLLRRGDRRRCAGERCASARRRLWW